MMTSDAAPQPTSWRDVYTLVQDVEARLVKRMDEIATATNTTATDHEVRIRVLERTDDKASVRNQTVLASLGGIKSILLVGFGAMGFMVALANFIGIIAH